MTIHCNTVLAAKEIFTVDLGWRETHPMRWLCFVALACAIACAQTPADTKLFQNHDPEKALITDDDVTLFWTAYDHWQNDLKGDPVKLPEALQTGYLDKGSQGVKDFIPGRIESAKHLSAIVLKYQTRITKARGAAMIRIPSPALPEIRSNFVRTEGSFIRMQFFHRFIS